MNCKELGYKVGDKFEVTKDTTHIGFWVGDIVELTMDDGTCSPKFKSGSNNEKFIPLDYVKKIEPRKTLLEILVDELPKRGGWPEGVDRLAQGPDKDIQKLSSRNAFMGEVGWTGDGRDDHRGEYIYGIPNRAYDYKTAIITRNQYESALAEKNEGWIKWGGGKCPVDDGVLVDVKYRDGEVGFNLPANGLTDDARDASGSFWHNDVNNNDIVAYRLAVQNDDDAGRTYGDDEEAQPEKPTPKIETLTDAIIEYGCEANLAYPLAKHLLSKGLFK